MVAIFYGYLSISGRLLVMLLSVLLLWSQNATCGKICPVSAAKMLQDVFVNVSVGFGCESLFETVRSVLPFFAQMRMIHTFKMVPPRIFNASRSKCKFI